MVTSFTVPSLMITGIVKLPVFVNALVAVIVIVGIGVFPSLTALIPVGQEIVPIFTDAVSVPCNAITCVAVCCVPSTLVVVPKNV